MYIYWQSLSTGYKELYSLYVVMIYNEVTLISAIDFITFSIYSSVHVSVHCTHLHDTFGIAIL